MTDLMPTKAQKETTLLHEVNKLFEIFDPVSVKLKNIDELNLSFQMVPKKGTDFKVLSEMGYEESTEQNLSVYSKWDFQTAIASNISVNDLIDTVTISMNY